jgi:hypothetical protein
MNETNRKGKGEDSYSVKQHNEELARQKNQYTLEEMAKNITDYKLEVIDFRGGEKNFVSYNGCVYERRMEEARFCKNCQKVVPPEKEYWYRLGEDVGKKEGGVEKKLEENVETKRDGNPQT